MAAGLDREAASIACICARFRRQPASPAPSAERRRGVVTQTTLARLAATARTRRGVACETRRGSGAAGHGHVEGQRVWRSRRRSTPMPATRADRLRPSADGNEPPRSVARSGAHATPSPRSRRRRIVCRAMRSISRRAPQRCDQMPVRDIVAERPSRFVAANRTSGARITFGVVYHRIVRSAAASVSQRRQTSSRCRKSMVPPSSAVVRLSG